MTISKLHSEKATQRLSPSQVCKGQTRQHTCPPLPRTALPWQPPRHIDVEPGAVLKWPRWDTKLWGFVLDIYTFAPRLLLAVVGAWVCL